MRQRGAREHFGDEGGGGAKHMESEAEITPTDENDHPALGQEKRMWSLACPPHELSLAPLRRALRSAASRAACRGTPS